MVGRFIVVAVLLACVSSVYADPLCVSSWGSEGIYGLFGREYIGTGSDTQVDYWFNSRWYVMNLEVEDGEERVWSSGGDPWVPGEIDQYMWFRLRVDGQPWAVIRVDLGEYGLWAPMPYTFQFRNGGEVWLNQDPNPVEIEGCTWGASMVPVGRKFKYVAASFIPATWYGLKYGLAVTMLLYIAVGAIGRTLRAIGLIA